jgi:hypothetical protein
MAPQTNSNSYGRQIVEGFGLQDDINNAIENGLYRVMADVKLRSSNRTNGQWVCTGHFVVTNNES